MAIVNPIHLNDWLPGTPILSTEAREEFMNVYNVINGGITADNITDGSLTGTKFADNSITGAKIVSIPASKITGQLTASQLPTGLLNTTGGTLTGTVVYEVAAGTALLKNYDAEEVVLYEGGTGMDKIKIIVGGAGNLLKITKNDAVLFTITDTGLLIPKQLQVPTE